MSKYDKMLEVNHKQSVEKIQRAKLTIQEMIEEEDKVTVPKLMQKTGLSRGFFYKNPEVRKAVDRALQLQAGMVDKRRKILDMAIEANPDIISHNMETVRRISPLVRSAANYDTSLQVIGHIARSGTKSKSGIMVGLGETPQEVETIMDDLLAVGCQILTIGQYLQPTHRHYPVAEYVTPQQFATYKTIGLEKGFSIVESAPLVRSSYHAEKHIR